MENIKYINFIKEDEKYRKKDRSPTHKIVIVYENGDKQYIGAGWYSETKGFGSIQLQEGVSFNIPADFKRYEAKKLTPEEQAEKDRKAEARRLKKEEDDKALAEALDYGEGINPDDIPF